MKIFNIETGEEIKICDTKHLCSINPLSSMTDAIHYIEHCEFSNDDSKVIYFHRWRTDDGHIYSRLFCYDLRDCSNRLVHDTGRLSHIGWLDSNTLVCVGSPRLSLASIVKRSWFLSKLYTYVIPLYRRMVSGSMETGQTAISRAITGDSYFLLNLATKSVKKLDPKLLSSDGHPRGISAQKFVSDTYPDVESLQHLFIFDCATGEKVFLDSFPTDPRVNFTPLRCDLHPKLSKQGDKLMVDIVEGGCRKVVVYEL